MRRRRIVRAAVAAAVLAVAIFAPLHHPTEARQGRKVTGVVEASGVPVAGAHVVYKEAGQETQTTVTDAKGHFELGDRRSGAETIEIRPGMVRSDVVLTLP